MPSANDTILDDAILQLIFLQRYKTYAVRKIVSFFNTEIEPELVSFIQREFRNLTEYQRRKIIRLDAFVEDIIARGMREITKVASEEVSKLAVLEATSQVESIRSVLPIVINLEEPAPVLLKAIINTQPFQGDLLKDWFNSVGEAAQKNIRRQVNMGLVGGDSVSDIVTRIVGTPGMGYGDGVLQTTRRNLDAVVRTAITHVSNQARQITYEENKAVISGVQWVSTLDDRTSDICIGLDGEIFPIGSGPRPPAHINCRSTTVPVLKSWQELGIDLPELPEGTRASLNGQIPARINYRQWLEMQPLKVQDEILGPSRAKLFRSGDLVIDRFSDTKGRPLSLKGLSEKRSKRR